MCVCVCEVFCKIDLKCYSKNSHHFDETLVEE